MFMAFTTLMPSGTTAWSSRSSMSRMDWSRSPCMRISGLAVMTNSRFPESMASPAILQNSWAVPENTRAGTGLWPQGSLLYLRFLGAAARRSRSRSSSKSYSASAPKASVLSEAFKNTVKV